MAINTVATGNIRMSSGSGVSGSMVYNLWSSLYQPTSNCSYSLMFATRNTTSGERKASNMGGLSSSFSFSPLYIDLANSYPFTPTTLSITANCAWYGSITYDQNGNFYIGAMSGAASLGGSYGGNGYITIGRNSANTSGTGQLTLTYCNGTSGSQTISIYLYCSPFY